MRIHFSLLALALFFLGTAQSQDTLEFFSDKLSPQEAKKEIVSILESNDLRAIADLYNRTAINFANENEPNRAIGYFNKAIALYDSAQAAKEKAMCYSNIATVYYDISRYEKAVEYLKKAHFIFHHLNDTASAAQQKIDIAFIYSNTFRSNKAIENFKEGLKLYDATNDTSNLAKTYYYIGKEFLENNILDSATVYYKLSLELDKKQKKPEDIASSHNNIGVIYYEAGLFNQAKVEFEQSYAIAKKASLSTLEGTYFNNIANIEFENNNLVIADSLYQTSLRIKRRIGDRNGEAATLHNLGNVRRKQKQKNDAIAYFEESLALSAEMKNRKYTAKNYKILSEIYKEEGDHKKAFEYYQEFIANMYSVLAEDSHRQLTESQEKYESTRKVAASIEREMKMQQLFADYTENIKKKEIQAAKEDQKIRRSWNYFFILLLILTILAVYITLLRNKEKRRANRKLDAQNKEIERSNKTIERQADELIASNAELEKLSIVARETDSAILIMDAQGNFEWINESCTRLFGFTIEELTNNISPNMIGENTPQYIRDKFEHCITTKQTVTYDFKTTAKGGKTIWLSVTLTPILDGEGEISKLVSIDTDITSIKNAEAEILQQKEEIETQRDELLDQHDYIVQQKEEINKQKNELADSLKQLQTAQKKLVESEKMAALGNLVAGVAHEINTPVGIGLAASSSMYNKSEQIEELFSTKKLKMTDLKSYIENATQACELILANLNRTAELVKSFKQVSIDNMTEQKREFVLSQYLDDIIRSLAPKIKHRNIEIETECPDDMKLTSYPGAFAQIFTNFIINSLLHAYEETDKGIIRIQISNDEKNLIAIYSDDGKGIPEENLSKIFDPFFTTNMQEGTGLGMNITYNLVTQKLGGEIALDSKVGEGVRFTISIPKEQLHI